MRKKKVTPRQAGSARTLDRWQRAVEGMLKILEAHGDVRYCPACRVKRGLHGLRASIRMAERR